MLNILLIYLIKDDSEIDQTWINNIKSYFEDMHIYLERAEYAILLSFVVGGLFNWFNKHPFQFSIGFKQYFFDHDG